MGDDFTQYLDELDSPNTEGYTFFAKSQSEGYFLEIYRKYEEVGRKTNKQTSLMFIKLFSPLKQNFNFAGHISIS